MVSKLQRKSGKEVEIDIKPMMKTLIGEVVDKYIMLTCKINAGSVSNLSPEMVLTTFCSFAGIVYDRAEVSIKRTEICYNWHIITYIVKYSKYYYFIIFQWGFVYD